MEVTTGGRRRLAEVLPRPVGPRPVWGRAGDLRCPRRTGRAIAATLRAPAGNAAGPTTRPTCVGHPKARGGGSALLHRLRPTRRGGRARPVRPRRRRPGRELPQSPTTSRGRADVLAYRVPTGDLAPDLVQQPQRRLNREIRRRTDVVGIFPDRTRIIASSALLAGAARRMGRAAAATSDSTSSPPSQAVHAVDEEVNDEMTLQDPQPPDPERPKDHPSYTTPTDLAGRRADHGRFARRCVWRPRRSPWRT